MLRLYYVTTGDDAEHILRDGFTYRHSTHHRDPLMLAPLVRVHAWPGSFDPRRFACLAIDVPIQRTHIAHMELGHETAWGIHPADLNAFCDIRQLSEAETTQAILKRWERDDNPLLVE